MHPENDCVLFGVWQMNGVFLKVLISCFTSYFKVPIYLCLTLVNIRVTVHFLPIRVRIQGGQRHRTS